jgi:hypothetical protein
MPSQEERLKRIAKNYGKLPKKQAQNVKKSDRGAEIIRHATSTASGVPVAHHRPQSRVKQK